MKKFMITVLALLAAASVSMAGIGIGWGNGEGWAVEFGGDPDEGPGVADNNDVLWQLIYAGADETIDPIDLADANYLSGDDELLADRLVPAGGGDCADGTSWDGWLMQQSGSALYQDTDFNPEGEYVYQRIFQGLPEAGSYYYETELFKFNTAFAGGGQAPDEFYFSDGAIEMDQQVESIPEPATMSLLGLGALAMVIRRKLRK